MKKSIFIISITSDIGTELAKFYFKKCNVYGTYRSKTKNYYYLKKIGIKLYKCDLNNRTSINNFIKQIDNIPKWNYLIVSAGTQNPIGRFENINFKSWRDGFNINFINQLELLHVLLNKRIKSKKNSPRVLFFAGGGTNNATVNYSSYTIAKIASIKMVELLDEEIKDTVFSILGPGWVKTKIHQETLNNKKKSEANYYKTLDVFNKNSFFPMEKLITCIDWILNEKKEIVAGRNFSAVHDPWNKKEIQDIVKNENNFKLRRFGNEKFS